SRDQTLLDVYDQQLAELGARRMLRRAHFIAEIAPRFRRAFDAIARLDRPADLAYAPSLTGAGENEPAVASALAHALAESRGRDIARAATSVGPHRDDID